MTAKSAAMKPLRRLTLRAAGIAESKDIVIEAPQIAENGAVPYVKVNV